MQEADMLSEIQKKTQGKKRVVFVSGNFNVVHPGHLRLLKFASECGEYLIVGLNPDGSFDAYVAEHLRLDGIKSIGFVNQAFIMRKPVDQVLRDLKPNIVVKGNEHEALVNPEQQAIEEIGGKLLFGSGDIVFSSIDLLKREARELNHASIIQPVDYLDRHRIEMKTMRSIVRRFSEIKMVVVGDAIVDEYISCEPLGMSQEDPTIVVTPVHTEKFLGGSGIVAAHASSLGAKVKFVSVVGDDPTSDFVRTKLRGYGVEHQLLKDLSRPSTLKQRFRAGGKTLLRVSHLKQHPISQEHERRLVESVLDELSSAQLLVFSDFNYGILSNRVVEAISQYCKQKKILMVADSQSSSQVGDISRYQDCYLTTPTEREARLALRDFSSGLIVLGQQLRTSTRTQNVIITLGAEGMLIHAGNLGTDTDQLPALNRNPKDTAGAGDSFLTCASMASVVGARIWEACYLGALAAARQVSRLGNVPLRPADLEAELVRH